ncbi:hypothetical protein D3C76_613960 [compost metagenome]
MGKHQGFPVVRRDPLDRFEVHVRLLLGKSELLLIPVKHRSGMGRIEAGLSVDAVDLSIDPQDSPWREVWLYPDSPDGFGIIPFKLPPFLSVTTFSDVRLLYLLVIRHCFVHLLFCRKVPYTTRASQ